MFSAQQIIDLHTQAILVWKDAKTLENHEEILKLVLENHHFNYQLWHMEDKARRDDRGFEYVYNAKRAIDGFNQERNDRMEAIDSWLYEYFKITESGILHSETPGMIIDRLSILSLKNYHMKLQLQRSDTTSAHLKKCKNKLEILDLQKTRLGICLEDLFASFTNKERYFKIYRQCKMYNDVSLNPQLYAKSAN